MINSTNLHSVYAYPVKLTASKSVTANGTVDITTELTNLGVDVDAVIGGFCATTANLAITITSNSANKKVYVANGGGSAATITVNDILMILIAQNYYEN